MIFATLLNVLLIAILGLSAALAADVPLTFCCDSQNDLLRMLRRSGTHVSNFPTVREALEHSAIGSGVCLLNGEQPSPELLSIAHSKSLKIYLELNAQDVGTAKTKQIEWERVITTSAVFGEKLNFGRILSIGRPKMVVGQAENPLLVVGRVAGFDTLAFGMPKTTDPLLWQENATMLVAAVPLSNCMKARFAPAKSWQPVLKYIVTWLGAPKLADSIKWIPEVVPRYGMSDRVPAQLEVEAMKRAANWFMNAGLMVSKDGLKRYQAADQYNDRVGPGPDDNGTGELGILEGFSSAIDSLGEQPVRYYRRADCNAESAMALALTGNRKQRAVAYRIADFIGSKSRVIHDDPSKQSYGLVGWNDQPSNSGNFYGDDNARYVLGLIGSAGALNESKWDRQILKCILANFRTTGVNGFRGDNLLEGDIENQGWRHFYEAKTVNMAPHFEAYMWALYLWAYQKTGYKPLYDRTLKAIERTVKAGDTEWTWTNGVQQERARMLLPLSWLVRTSDTPEHRKWLIDAVRKVILKQQACGAIQEEIGDLSRGIAGPPRSNEAFGTGETPLIQENGDPLADMLYTTNFAFLGLHEAASVLNDPETSIAENKLAEFLCRIQIRADSRPKLNGAWFRAFDFGDWDYWASNADLGWGAWSIETGWSVSWIASVLALRNRHQAFWDIHPKFKADSSLVTEMLSSSSR